MQSYIQRETCSDKVRYKRMKQNLNANQEISATLRAIESNGRSSLSFSLYLLVPLHLMTVAPISPKWISRVINRCGDIQKPLMALRIFEAYKNQEKTEINEYNYSTLISVLVSACLQR